MKSFVKTVIIVGCVVLTIAGVIGAIIVYSVNQYHDRNSWATFRITGDGIAAGQTKYKSKPDENVREGPDWKMYGKGETIDLGYATFTVVRVDIGKTEGVSITSESDLVFNGEVVHKVYLTKDEECEIHSSNKSAKIKLTGIGYQ